jgi:hypothetical protein
MLDQSGSMNDPVMGGGTKWTAVTGAMKAFFSDPANAAVGVGIQFFGLPKSCTKNSDCGGNKTCQAGKCSGGGMTDSCVAADYTTPAIEIAPLSAAQAAALSTSIGMHMPSTSTPTSAALQGLVDHTKAWETANPTHVTLAILVTDGDPTECDTNLANIDAIAATALAGAPSVKTFVIGVGASLANLNGIAAAGGTQQAFLVDTNANVVAQFEAALKALQGSVVGCQYLIPAPAPPAVIDYNKVNVQYTPGNGPPQALTNVANAAACPPAGGWYYDDNAAPTEILLCPASCTTVSADPAAKVQVLLGCATMHN